jgi:hypothetical protein
MTYTPSGNLVFSSSPNTLLYMLKASKYKQSMQPRPKKTKTIYTHVVLFVLSNSNRPTLAGTLGDPSKQKTLKFLSQAFIPRSTPDPYFLTFVNPLLEHRTFFPFCCSSSPPCRQIHYLGVAPHKLGVPG